MKVICIDNKAESSPNCIGNFMPTEGNVYTVIETVNWYGSDWYLLKEDDGGNGWNPAYFVPLSNKSETAAHFNKLLKGLLSTPKFKKLKKAQDMKKNIGQDYKYLVTDKFITDRAESHLECWKDRYAGKRKKDVAFDISMNHDDSLEVELTEEELKRKLSDDEYNDLTFRFHKKVPQLYMRQLIY